MDRQKRLQDGEVRGDDGHHKREARCATREVEALVFSVLGLAQRLGTRVHSTISGRIMLEYYSKCTYSSRLLSSTSSRRERKLLSAARTLDRPDGRPSLHSVVSISSSSALLFSSSLSASIISASASPPSMIPARSFESTFTLWSLTLPSL